MDTTDNKEPLNGSTNNNSQIDLTHHLLNKGELYYISKGVDIKAMAENVTERIKTELNFKASYSIADKVHLIRYNAKGGLGFKTAFQLFFIVEDNKLFFDIKSDKWFETGKDKFSVRKFFSTVKYKEIRTFIFDYLMRNTISDIYSTKLDESNYYINEISDKKRLWFYCNSEDDEIMLSFLKLSSQRESNEDIKTDKEIVWYFLITSINIKFLAFNDREELVQELDCEPNTLKVNKELGRNRLTCSDTAFLCQRSNNDMFYNLGQVDLSSQISRIREIARLNWLKADKNEACKHFTIELLKSIVAEYHLLEDEISILYIEYTKSNREDLYSLFSDNNNLLALLDKIVISTDAEKWLVKWVEKWNISYVDAAAINDLLLSSVDDAAQANNTLEFHRFVRQQLYEQDKDKINRALFDISFCKHLIKSGLVKEAKKILKKNLKHLPDENILDLLPSKDIDLTGMAAGQIIKVKILELLISIESEKNAAVHKCQLACLQPLVELRIDELIKVSEEELSIKGKTLKNIMLPNGVKKEDDDTIIKKEFNYDKINVKSLDKYVRHPLSKKGGHFTKFQKWLATVKTDDYTILKSYSEQLTTNVYEDLNHIINDITQTLNLKSLEVFIARGEKSFGISSFEGEPNFVLVGINHLDKNSKHYLNPLELRYAVANELAHLYFKHARITSSDIWRGALDKGNIVLDTILTFVPAANLFGKSIQGISKLNSISTLVQTTSKAGKITNTSKEILTASDQLMKIYQSKKAKTEIDKEKEFWATARIMQATSDRCALALTRDIKAAVRAILILSKYYNFEIANIEETGLREYLLAKKEDGSFEHQELAIRLSNLFSFYLSDDYQKLLS